MTTKKTFHTSFLILLFLTLIASVWYILITIQQNNGIIWSPIDSMHEIRTQRDRYSVTSKPWDQLQDFTVHIGPDSPDIQKILCDNAYGTIRIHDISMQDGKWWIYLDFIGKGDSKTFTMLSLDVDQDYTNSADSDDTLKISYIYNNQTIWHKQHWNSMEYLPNGERIGYQIFKTDDELAYVKTIGELDITCTMSGLHLLTWQKHK